MTYFSEPEGSAVLPERSVSMDGGRDQAPAAPEQTASDSVGVMECRDGARALVCADGGQSLLSHGPSR